MAGRHVVKLPVLEKAACKAGKAGNTSHVAGMLPAQQ
jgi:hypothetical protein